MANDPNKTAADDWPKVNKVFLYIGLGMLLLLILSNIPLIYKADQMLANRPSEVGPYSIYASKAIWIAYHSWGIIAGIGLIVCWLMKQRLLFMVFLLILMILMFYPYFTT